MNNLLFTALIIALLYYFFYYLPHQKKLLTNPHPTKLTHSIFTQTDPDPTLQTELDLERTKRQELEKQEKDYQKQIREKNSQITSLQTQIRELVKRPTNSKETQTEEPKDLEKTLDTLIKNIQDLNNSLES